MILPGSLKKLWLGQLPLREAFWRYLITYDIILNIMATAASLSVVLAKGPIALAVFIHLLPAPYSLFAATGTWRSADRHTENPSLAGMVKAAVIIWVILLLLL